jgi:hypothetical protein
MKFENLMSGLVKYQYLCFMVEMETFVCLVKNLAGKYSWAFSSVISH